MWGRADVILTNAHPQSDSEQSADDSDADSDVAMDTAEHLQQDLT